MNGVIVMTGWSKEVVSTGLAIVIQLSDIHFETVTLRIRISDLE